LPENRQSLKDSHSYWLFLLKSVNHEEKVDYSAGDACELEPHFEHTYVDGKG